MPYNLTVVREKIDSYDVSRDPVSPAPHDDYRIRNSEDVYNLLKDQARAWDREHFVAIPLTTKNEVIGLHVVSIGSLSSAVIHPREVFKVALLVNAAAIIVAHNHPSGDPTPSHQDREITRRLKDAASTLGIPLHDHVILADDGKFYSFADESDVL